jgi:hypothetical protein
MGMAMGLRLSAALWLPLCDGAFLTTSLLSPPMGPSEMYCDCWKSQTTYGSTLGRNARPSLMTTVSFPRTGPMVVPSVGMDGAAAGGEADPLPAWSSWDRVRGVCGGVLCIDGGDASPVVSLLFSGSEERAEAEVEICANNDDEDLENKVVNADVQETTADSEGCAQGVRLEFLEDIGGLSLGLSMPTAARGES